MARRPAGDEPIDALPVSPSNNRWTRLALVIAAPVVILLIVFLLLWNSFFVYVRPGEMLIVTSNLGSPLPEGKIIADKGEKGIQREVLGEGWHFITPIAYETSRGQNVVIEAGKVGIVTAQDGSPLPAGRILAEEGEKGLQRKVLPPGAYRLNPHLYKVEQVAVTEIKPGFVGVQRRLLGDEGTGQFAENESQKGILKKKVLQPGIYFLNTKEFEVLPREVGIYQITYHYYPPESGAKSTALKFPAGDGNEISLDCTIEYEVLPENWPLMVARYDSLKRIEETVVGQNAQKICRDLGLAASADSFLDGAFREKFQEDFRTKLDTVCKENNVEIRSGFIRNIVIPDKFLSPKREEQLAVEAEKTSKELALTAETTAKVAKAKEMIKQGVAEVEAETARMVAKLDRDAENVKVQLEANLEKAKADYGKKIAELDGQSQTVLGEAKASVVEMKRTAESSLYKLKMAVFNKDGEAYLRYSMAQELNPNLKIRLYQSGPGTLWTNMGDKGMNLFMPLGGPAKPEEGKTEKKP